MLMTVQLGLEFRHISLPRCSSGAELRRCLYAAFEGSAGRGRQLHLEVRNWQGRVPEDGETVSEAGLLGVVHLQVRTGLAGGMGGGLGRLAGGHRDTGVRAGAAETRSPAMVLLVPDSLPEGTSENETELLGRQKAVGRLQRLTADAEEAEMARCLFNQIDSNHDGVLSVEELGASIARYKDQGRPLELALATALERLIERHAIAPSDIYIDAFSEIVKDLPRVRSEMVQFAQALGLHEVLAGLLPKGSFLDGLEGLRELAAHKSDDEVAAFARETASHLTAEVEALLIESICKLRDSGADYVSALEQNSKFSMEADAKTSSFAELKNFYDGPEKLIGTPNPKANEGIKREHCGRKNSDTKHTTPNYNVLTWPNLEYYFVVNPSMFSNDEYPHIPKNKEHWSETGKALWKGGHGRDIFELKQFTQHPTAQKAGLGEAEVVALRLYTGPMYVWYNAVLRHYPTDIWESLEGNRYETTIFCIISGIVKLSRLTEVPEDRRLYRGLGGMLLPDSFWTKAEGFRGGVERGLMSTTTDRRVAMQYSGADRQRGTVFEISVGRIDIGADLAWVSQYPGEREVLFPPLSCLEVMGEPRVEGGVIVVPLRVNMCLKGLTLEQLVERRKALHMAMVANLKEELSIQAPAALSGSDSAASCAAGLLESVGKQFEALKRRYEDTPPDDFNDDGLYKTYTAEAIEGKSLAIKKVEIFADQLRKGAGAQTLDAIMARPLGDFASRAVVLELETGMPDFPWRDVVDGKAVVNFGRWRPERIEPSKLDRAVAELFSQANFRTAMLLCRDGEDHSLTLPEGVASKWIAWSQKRAAEESPAFAALLIQRCAAVETLDLRCPPARCASRSDPSLLPLVPGGKPHSTSRWLRRSNCQFGDYGAVTLARALAPLTALDSLDLRRPSPPPHPRRRPKPSSSSARSAAPPKRTHSYRRCDLCWLTVTSLLQLAVGPPVPARALTVTVS